MRFAAIRKYFRQFRVRKGPEALTGNPSIDAVIKRERLVTQSLKDMLDLGLNDVSAYRIVMYNVGRLERDALDKLELAFGEAEIGSTAAVKWLARAGLLEFEMLEKYAYLGYQSLMVQRNPLMAAVKTTYVGGPLTVADLNVDQLVLLRQADAERLRQIDAQVWQYSLPMPADDVLTPRIRGLWADIIAEINPDVIEELLDPGSRNAVNTPGKRAAICMARPDLAPDPQ